MRYYIGVIHKEPASDYGISFPDFPCISAGRSFEEVMQMGREALQVCLAEMLAAGESVPDPTAVEAVMADPVFADGEPVLIGVSADELGTSERRAA